MMPAVVVVLMVSVLLVVVEAIVEMSRECTHAVLAGRVTQRQIKQYRDSFQRPPDAAYSADAAFVALIPLPSRTCTDVLGLPVSADAGAGAHLNTGGIVDVNVLKSNHRRRRGRRRRRRRRWGRRR